MKKFKLSENIDPNKVFIINRSELEGRLDINFNSFSIRKIVERIKSKGALKLIDITEPIKNGSTPSDGKFENSGVTYYRSQDFTLYSFSKNQYISEIFNSKIIRSYIKKGDILLAVVGATLGKVGYVYSEELEGNINQNIARIRINDERFLSEFVAIYLDSNIGQKLIQRYATITTQAYLNNQQLGKIPIPLLKIEVQQNIINILKSAYLKKQQKEAEAQRLLDSIDDYLLGELGITLPKEEEYLPQNTDKNSSYNLDNDNPLVKKGRLFLTNLSEVTGKRIDPKGYDIKTKLLKSSIDNIDLKKFIALPLKSFIIQSITGNWGIDENEEVEENEEYQKCLVIRATEFDNQYNLNLDNSRVKYRLIKKSILSKIDLKENDLLIEKSGGSPDQPVGRIAIITQNIIKDNVLCYSNFIHKIRVNNKKINPEYLFCFLKMMHNIRLTEAMQSQTNGIRNLIMNSYLNQNIVIPVSENGKIDIQKQTEIANRITTIREEAKKLQLEAINTLETAKKNIEQMILGN
ncbi:restriction endonuclease subunit S [Capnocytophaga genosp. AHN8471]|uniref:Restriction endonuclease subunit S n=1 Tax=Capnocytophaga genosp. AHN8471 TaxID=327574 RepID=A0ABS1YW46_9FLAO|nr:restriction endonuclease subunit S [Capnocytophaga genosp. AHN8471]MBM0650625.1 restriction endonuclease subunit S [Capnocytophaga genosp. AHN8471]MBM0661813.1 restriction endonuclease subunit S [Capnocytophaga genosp. AHN8471]